MDRTISLDSLLAAIVGIAAIALAAAAMGQTVSDVTAGSPTALEEEDGYAEWEGLPVSELPDVLWILLAVGGAFVAALMLLYFVAHAREFLTTWAGFAVGVAFFVFVIWLVATVGAGDVLPTGGEETAPQPDEGTGNGEDVDPWAGAVLAVVAPIVGFFLISIGILLFVRGRGDEPVESPVADDLDDVGDTTATIGDAAGDAADRIAGASGDDLKNEVYRAWYEMVRALDVDRPGTSTPGEFAVAAVDAGMRPNHVEELTVLFEGVRYGHHDTTTERETRAIETLRRIEETYGPDADGESRDGVGTSGKSDRDAGKSDRDAGKSDRDAGKSDRDAGKSDRDAGNADSDAGNTDSDAGNNDERNRGGD